MWQFYLFFFTCFHNSCMSTLVASSLISTLIVAIFHVGSGSFNLLNAIPLHIHVMIIIQIVCSFPHLVTRILDLHVQCSCSWSFSSSSSFNIFESPACLPETSSSCDQRDLNLPIISTIVAYINSHVPKCLCLESQSLKQWKWNVPFTKYPAALKFCPKS